MAVDIAELVARARRGDPEAVEELVEHVEAALAEPARSVATAFALRRRGGEQPRRAAARKGRDKAIRALAPGKLSLERQAQLVAQKLTRYKPAPGDAEAQGERHWLWEIEQSGLPKPGRRQVRRILEESSDMQSGD